MKIARYLFAMYLPLIASYAEAASTAVLASQVTQQCPLISRDASVRLISDAKTWQSLFPFDAAASGNVFGREPDWQREAVVVLSLGGRPNLGYSIELIDSDSNQEARRLNFTVRERKPAAGDMVAQAMANPCVIALIEKREWCRIQMTDDITGGVIASTRMPPMAE